MADYNIDIEAKLNGFEKAEAELNSFLKEKRKVEIDVEVGQNTSQKLVKNIEQSLKNTKINTSKLSENLAESFNIKNPKVINKMKSQMDSMMSSLAKTWNGKNFNFAGTNGFYSGLNKLGETVTKNANIMKSKMGIYDDFYSYFKDKKIYVSDEVKSQLGDSVYRDLLKSNVGKFTRDAKKGISIDSIWGEMKGMFPEHFSKDISNQADQILHVIDLVKKARADMNEVIPSNQLSTEQFGSLKNSAYTEVINTSQKMSDALKKNLIQATEESKSHFQLEVDIDPEKIRSDLQNAIQSATSSMSEGLNFNIKINEEQIISELKSAISKLGNGEQAVEINVKINKENLQAELNTILSDIELPVHLKIDSAEIEASIRQALSSITDMQLNLHISDIVGTEIRKEIEEGTNSMHFDSADATNLENVLNGINIAGQSGQSIFQSFGSTLKEAFGYYTLANVLQDAIFEVGDAAKEAVSTVKELNDATTSLQMATGDSYSKVKDMMSSYNELGQELGAVTTDVSTGAEDWLRQGKTASEANTLVKDSMVLSKVANLNSEDSTAYLTAMQNGFHATTEEVNGLVDALTSVDLVSATDAGGLAEATSKVAASADVAGVSFNKLLGYEAAVGEASQEGMSVIGNAFKSIFTRMSDIKSDKLELIDENGTTETVSDVETVLKNAGINLRDETNEFRNFGDVLDDTASKWNNFSSVQKAAVSKAFAGTYQSNRFKLLMENYGKAQEYENVANDSAGTSDQKFQDAYMNSLEAKTNSLKASLEALASSTISDSLYASVLDTTKAMVDMTNQTGILKGALAGLGTAGGLFVAGKMVNGITDAVQQFANLSEAMKLVESGGTVTGSTFTQLMNLTSGLSNSQVQLVASSTALTNAQRMSILTNAGMSEQQAATTASTIALATAEGTATGATVTFGGAMSGLMATLAANPLLIVAAGVGATVAAVTAYNNHVNKIVEEAKSSLQDVQSSQASIEEQKQRVEELRNSLASGTLSEEEARSAKSELLSIQNQLTESYGSQANSIDLLNGKLENQLNLMSQLSDSQAIEWLNENQKASEKAMSEMERTRDYSLGQLSENGTDDKTKKAIDSLIEKYGFTKQEGYAGAYTLHFNGDAKDAEQSLQNFMEDVRSLQNDSNLDGNYLNKLLGNSSDALNDAQKVVDKYDEVYSQAKMAEMASDKTRISTPYDKEEKQKTYSDLYKDYAQAIDDYNTALNNGNTDKVDEAYSKFTDIKNVVDSLGTDNPYDSLFDSLTDGISEASVAAQDFKEVLVGESTDKLSSDYQRIFGIKNNKNALEDYAQDIKDLKLSASDFTDILQFGDVNTEGKLQVEALVQAAEDLGMISGETESELQPLLTTLQQLGIINVSDGINETAQSFLTLSNSAQGIATSISQVNELLNGQTTGKSISVDDYNADELKDYRDALEYVNGSLQLNKEKVDEITKAKAEEAIANNDAAKAQKQQEYLKNVGEIEQLQEKLKSLSAESDEYVDVQTKISDLQSTNDTLVNQCNQFDLLSASIREATGEYQEWLNSQNASESGDMFDDTKNMIKAIDDVNNEDSEDYGKIGTKKYQAAVDFLVPDTIDKDDEEAVNKYVNGIKDYLTTNEDGEIEGLNLDKFLSTAVDKGLMNKDGDEYQIAGQTTMEDFAKGMQMSLPMIQAVFGELQEYFGQDAFNWSDEIEPTIGNLGMKAQEAKEQLQALDAYKNMDIKIDVSDIDNDEDKVTALKSTIKQMQDLKASPKVDTSSIENADSVIAYCIAQEQELENPVIMKADTSVLSSDIANAVSKLQELVNAQNQLQSNKALGVDTSDAQGKVNSLVKEIQGLNPDVKAKLEIDTTSLASINSSLANMSPKVQAKLNIDTSAANNLNVDKNAKVTYNPDISKLPKSFPTINRTVKYVASGTNSLPSSFGKIEREVHYYKTGAGTVSGTAHASGIAHAAGTAKLTGDWGMDGSKNVLIGELGREIVVDPSTGKWRTYGDNGAEFAHIPNNAIVFNHLQTESLLNQGFVNSRAKALVGGTAFANGNAFVKGHFIYKGKSQKSNNSSDTDTSSNNKNSTTKKTKSNSDKSKKKTTKKGKTALEKFQDYLERFFDWIEVRLKKLQTNTERYQKKAENARTLKGTTSNYESAYKSTKSEISANHKGAVRYRKQANTVKNQAVKRKIVTSKQAKGLVKKIKNGTINIGDYGEKAQEFIKAYQEYWDKAEECRTNQLDLQQQLYELEQKKLDSITDYYDTLNNLYKSQQEIYSSSNDLIKAQGGSESTNSTYYKNLLSQRSKQASQTSTLQKEKDAYASELKTAKKRFGENSNEAREAQTKYNEIVKELNDSKTAYEDLNSQIREVTYNLSQWAIDKWTGVADRLSAAASLFKVKDTSNATRRKNLEKIYTNQMSANNNTIVYYEKLRNDKIMERNKYDKSSTKWNELNSEVSDLDVKILGLASDNEDLKDSIQELRFEPFEKMNETIDNNISDIEHLIDLMGDAETVAEDGTITDTGNAQVLLNVQKINQAQMAISNYKKEMSGLETMYKNGQMSEEDYLSKKREIIEAQQKEASTVKDSRNAILQIYKDSLQKENDLLQKNITKRQNALKAKQDYYNYNKTLQSKNKDITTVQNEIAALEGTTSAAGKARLEELKAQLKDLQDDYDDTVRDHENDIRSEGYDKISEDASDALDKTLTALESNSKMQTDVVNKMLDGMVNSYQEAYDKINEIIRSSGTTVSESTQNITKQTESDLEDTVSNIKNGSTSTTLGNVDTSTIKGGGNENKAQSAVDQVVNQDNSTEPSLTKEGQIRKKIQDTEEKNKEEEKKLKQKQIEDLQAKLKNANIEYSKAYTKTKKHIATMKKSAYWKYINDAKRKKIENHQTISTKSLKKGKGLEGAEHHNNYVKSENKKKSKAQGYVNDLKKLGVKAAVQRIKGYATGGITNELLPVNDITKVIPELSKVISTNGDEGLITARLGEMILPERPVKNLVPEFIKNVEKASEMAKGGELGDIHIENNLIVQGSIDKDTFPGVKKMQEMSYDYITKQLKDDLGKLGHKKGL